MSQEEFIVHIECLINSYSFDPALQLQTLSWKDGEKPVASIYFCTLVE